MSKVYICKKCKKRVRVNYPFGQKSDGVESGHDKGCKGPERVNTRKNLPKVL